MSLTAFCPGIDLEFEFVGPGSTAEGVGPGEGRLYLDVGNMLGPGIIDHHQLAAFTGSTTSLVVAHPDLVAEALDVRQPGEPRLTVVLHRKPDLDCLCATYLAIRQLADGTFPPGSRTLARYVDKVDAGYPGMTQKTPFTLYSAYHVLADRLLGRVWNDDHQKWLRCVLQGLEVVDFVVGQQALRKTSILEIDAFQCPGLFGPRDRQVFEKDLDRYRRKLEDPATRRRIVALQLPGQLGGVKEVPALLVRGVQGVEDPERCLFFKDWARTDSERSPNRSGFVALSVYQHEDASSHRRCIISVTPDSEVSLLGLGEALEQAETAAREQAHGRDDRDFDPDDNAKPKRPGYASADPWYDGRSDDYTIVDAPGIGTVLTAETIENILLDFGQSGKTHQPPALPGRHELRETPEADRGNLRRFSFLVSEWRRSQGSDRTLKAPEVFISYPHTEQELVREHLYRPLVELRGAENVFFDEDSLDAGVSWMASLADAIAECRVFLAFYCADYFRSDFCEWELQLSLKRDPTGKKRILIPVAIKGEDFTLPEYCSLIQYKPLARDRLADRMIQILSPLF